MRHRRPRRRITRTLGAAAGGLLGVAFLPAAAAFADDWDIDPDPVHPKQSPEFTATDLQIRPGSLRLCSGSIQGNQEFDVHRHHDR